MGAAIFSGPLVRALKAALRLNDQATIWSGSTDPTSTPTFGRQGDLYIKFGATPGFYQKTTADGTDTNWNPVPPNAATVLGPSSATDNAITRFDGTTGKLVQNSLATIDDSGNLSAAQLNSSTLTASRIVVSDVSDNLVSSSVTTTTLGYLDATSSIQTQLDSKIPLSQKAANNGVATLDSGGKIPLGQLPASLMEYQGTWNATTNTPTLADGTGVSGYFYRVNVGGTQDLGSGSQTFVVGDWVMYNGSIWQLAHAGADAVLSVNSQTGVVTLTTTDIAEGTNLYYTDSRAEDAVGGILANTTTINLTYDSGTPSISAVVNSGSLTDTHINASAAIAVSKLAALTASKAVASDSSGFLVASTTTATELGYVSGVTSAIQTQLNGKQATITVLPIANGGTNSNTALNNNRVITSVSGAIVEAAAITAARVLVSDSNGLPTSSSITTTTLAFLDATSSIQTQLNGKQATGSYITGLTGDVTASGPGSVAATIAANAVTNAKAAQMTAHTYKGNNTGSTANAADITSTQLTADLNLFTSLLQGLVPASGGGTTNFLRADGNFAAPPSAATPTIFGSRGSPLSIVAATGITSGSSSMSTTAVAQDIYVQGSITGDSVAATITAGTIDGQRMCIIGRTDTQTLTLNSTTTNVALNGSVTLGAGDVITLRFDGTNWHEVDRS